MPLTFSPPPGIPEYCNPGKLLNRVITLLSGFFAMPAFFQPRVLTGNKVKAGRTATCSVIAPGDFSIRGVATGISSGFREKFYLKKFFN
jgi:hypothetical protein